MSSAEYLQDWSAWIRFALSGSAEEYARGQEIRRHLGDEVYWQEYGEGLGAEWKLAQWADAHVDAWRAWGQCPRADWLLVALASGRAAVRTRVLCACDVARTGLRHVSSHHPQVEGAIAAAEAWAQGTEDLARVVQSAQQASQLADQIQHPAARLAALAAAAPAAIVHGAAGIDAAHAALAAGPDPHQVTQAHLACAQLIVQRRWTPTVATDVDLAEPDLREAWEWLQRRIPVVQLSTTQLLASYSVRWALIGAPSERDTAHSPLISAMAERIAAAPDPVRILDEFAGFLARPAAAAAAAAPSPSPSPRYGLHDV